MESGIPSVINVLKGILWSAGTCFEIVMAQTRVSVA